MIADVTRNARSLTVETVGRLNEEGGYLSLALDGQGQAQLVYWEHFETLNGRLHYAVRTTQGWQDEIVATTLGARSALALDGAGRPFIAYLDLAAGALMLARQSDEGWESETVTDELSAFAPGALCLRLDDDDRPLLSFYDQDQLKLARLTAEGWQVLTVDSAPGSGYHHDAALTAEGDLLLASANLISRGVRLWRVSPEGVVALEAEVAVPPGPFDYLSLALDGAGQPRLCYATDKGLMEALMVDGVWQEVAVKAGKGLGQYARIRSHGDWLRGVHYDVENGRLLVHRSQDGIWLEETIDGGDGRDVGGYADLVVDEEGTAHVAYYDWNNRSVHYLRDNTPPLAEDDRIVTFVNTVVSCNVLRRVSDLEGDRLTVNPEPVSGPRRGTLTLAENGDMTYRPQRWFNGQVRFSYEVRDERGLSNTAEVVIRVRVPVQIREVAEDPILGNPPNSMIELVLTDGGPDTWAGILRRTPQGRWVPITQDPGSDQPGMHGRRRQSSPWMQEWSIDASLFGRGPFRWAVYNNEADRDFMVFGPRFDMPGESGRRLKFSGSIARRMPDEIGCEEVD